MTLLRHGVETTRSQSRSVKLLAIVLAVQVALGVTLVALVATDNLPFTGDHEADGSPPRRGCADVDRFDGARGVPPASPPGGARSAPCGLAGVAPARAPPQADRPEGALPGGARRPPQRDRHRARAASRATWWWARTTTRRTSPASSARTTAPRARRSRRSSPARIRRPRHTVQFVFFDGEEAPRGDAQRLRGRRSARQQGGRRRRSRTRGRWSCSTSWATGGSRSRARRTRAPGLWRKLRAAARRVGRAAACSPPDQGGASSTTTSRSSSGACPSIDLIDFDFPCWHRRCDDMSAVSERSVDAVGETVYELLKTLRLTR